LPTISERLQSAWATFQGKDTAPVQLGEIAFADPRRTLFPSGFITPYNPGWLVSRKGIRIIDEMRRDDQIKASMSFKKGSVLSTEWSITSPEGQSDDWEVTKYVDETLKNLDETFEKAMWAMLSALEYGYSVTEKVWGPDATGKITLKALKTRRPHEFDFETDPYGNIKPDGVIQQQPKGPMRLPVEKFVLYAYDEEFQNPYGTTDLQAAYRHWWAKDNALKWLTILLERLGIPPIFGMYDPMRYTPQQIDDLKNVMQNIQAATFGVLPRPSSATKEATSAIEFWAPELAKQATDVFIPALEFYDRAVARALLMPGHLGLTNEEQAGSFAKAKVAFDVFMLIVEKIRKDLTELVVNDQIIRPLVDLNYTVDQYPAFRLAPIENDVRADLLATWKTLVDGSIVSVQDEDEVHIRAMLEFPELTPGAEKKELNPPPPDPFGGGGGFGDKPQGRPQPRENKQYASEAHYAKIVRDLDKLESSAGDSLKAQLTGVRDNLLAYIEQNYPQSPEAVSMLEVRGFAGVQDVLREFLREAYGLGDEAMRRELPQTFAFGPGAPFTPTEALRWLAQKALQVSGILRSRIIDEVRRVLLDALRFGELPGDTLGKLRDVFLPYLGDPGVIEDDAVVSPHRLETILRTNATEAFNQGRLTTVMDPKLKPFIRGMRYSAVIDHRTTDVCRYLDQKVFPLDEPDLQKLAPPNHFNCRAILVPITLDMTVDEREFITPQQAGRAEELAGQGFK
jgi:SPP1 gp7 family putative phage head morphogenesis protein